MSGNFYDKSYAKHLKQLKDLVPDQLEAWRSFSSTTLQEGSLTRKEKEIIAVTIAHITECPYCIDFHTKQAKKQGATLEELAEAVLCRHGGRSWRSSHS